MKQTINPPGCPSPPFHYSHAVKSGPLIFTSGQLATDFHSGIAVEAAVNPGKPYAGPPAISRQTRYIFKNLNRLLRAAGSSLDNMLRVEQFITGRADAPGFVEARKEFLAVDPPTSSLLVAPALELPDARIIVDGIAVASDGPWEKKCFTTDKVPINARGGYSLAQLAGPFVFLPGNTASDFKTGIHPDARVDHTFWFERDIVKQTEFILKTRRLVLEGLGLSLADIVQATVYLCDIADLPEFESVWYRHFAQDGPAVTVIPVAELAVLGSVVEISAIALDPSAGLPRRAINTDRAPAPAFRAPHAVQAGPYIFFSGLTASDANGLAPEASIRANAPYYASAIKRQTQYILGNVANICAAAGTSVTSLVKCQSFLTDFNDLVQYFDVWREFFPVDPPASTVVGANPPLIEPGCRVLQAWIAFAPDTVETDHPQKRRFT